MFSSPSPLLLTRGGGGGGGAPGGGGASGAAGGAKGTQLAPQTVASSSPNILSVVSHDLSDLQDDDIEESVDDSDSERGAPSKTRLRFFCLFYLGFSFSLPRLRLIYKRLPLSCLARHRWPSWSR